MFRFDVREKPMLSGSLVQIVVTRGSPLPDGTLAITEEMTAAEVDGIIRQLKGELDAVAMKAKTIAQ
jgi:hypothetical protein